MDGVTKLQELSGWILPDGSWKPAEEWWHVSVLYDLESEQCTALNEELRGALKSGDEALIRRSAANSGFIKISRQQLDLISLNLNQLRTIQRLLELMNPDEELTLLLDHGHRQKKMSVERMLKLRSVNPITS
ncbi:MAG: hypothetical protein RJB13_1326 [Pseudomonadota bacterium]|jgi:hypothetical protein